MKNDAEYHHKYYLRNREKLSKQQKEYYQRPENVAKRQTPAWKEKQRALQKKHRQQLHIRAKRDAYNKKYKEEHPDYWTERYIRKKPDIRVEQKIYDATPKARELKRKAASKPERKAKKAEYTRNYQARPDVHARRIAKSRATKKTDMGKQKARFYNERRRARMLNVGGTLTKEEWEIIKKKSNGICLHCGRYVGEDKLSMDHIMPLSKGGAHEASNIQALCRSCNSKKGNRNYVYQYHNGKLVKVFC